MQNLLVSTSSITPSCHATQLKKQSSFLSGSSQQWWCQQPDYQFALRGKGVVTVPAERSSRSGIVNAFFGLGGSKSSSAKAAGKGCFSCAGKGAVECAGCKGSGKNKKNGNMFERWKCYDCQGFGMVGCPKCGSGGLTPEQRGER